MTSQRFTNSAPPFLQDTNNGDGDKLECFTEKNYIRTMFKIIIVFLIHCGAVDVTDITWPRVDECRKVSNLRRWDIAITPHVNEIMIGRRDGYHVTPCGRVWKVLEFVMLRYRDNSPCKRDYDRTDRICGFEFVHLLRFEEPRDSRIDKQVSLISENDVLWTNYY